MVITSVQCENKAGVRLTADFRGQRQAL